MARDLRVDTLYAAVKPNLNLLAKAKDSISLIGIEAAEKGIGIRGL
jgi:hypothetical protein